MIRSILGATAALAVVGSPSIAQQSSPGETLESLYDVISGPVGEERDWDRFRGLFVEGARMTIVVPQDDGTNRIVTLSPEDYIERAGPNLVANGFTEVELDRRTYNYGDMATVLSTYEGIYQSTGEVMAVGLNTLVIVREGEEWKVASIAWRAADEDWPLERAFESEDR
jgi:hypothetical protein